MIISLSFSYNLAYTTIMICTCMFILHSVALQDISDVCDKYICQHITMLFYYKLTAGLLVSYYSSTLHLSWESCLFILHFQSVWLCGKMNRGPLQLKGSKDHFIPMNIVLTIGSNSSSKQASNSYIGDRDLVCWQCAKSGWIL